MPISSVPLKSSSAGIDALYTVYGLRVRSDIALPLPAESGSPDEGARADVSIRIHDVTRPPEPDGPLLMCRTCAVHGDVLKMWRGPGGVWFWLRSTGVYHIASDLKTVDVYPEGCEDGRALVHAVIQPVLVFILNSRGMPVLHASAVQTRQGAVAFLGMSGQGKSTMTAVFLRHGAALLTDDALPLRVETDIVYGVPGPPHMKLWDATAEHTLHLHGDLPNLTATLDKKYLALDGRFDYVLGAVPLRAVYVLRRYDPVAAQRTDVSIHRLSGRDGLVGLLRYTLLRDCLRPVEEGAFLPTYAQAIRQSPVRMLVFPSGFEHQDAIHHTILTDMDQQ